MRPSKPLVAALALWTALLAPAQADTLARARQLAAAGQLQPALQAAERALQAAPRDVELRFLRGVLLHDLGRLDAAQQAFGDLHQTHPELADPLNNLAVIHAARGEWQDARRRLEEALRNDPQHRSARENLGDVYLRLALEQWQAAAAGGRPEPALARKLSVARQLVTGTAD
jgi:Flp pilus assembly protein TadD